MNLTESTMKRWTFSILFFIKKTKLLKNQEAPVFMRITIDGQRAEANILGRVTFIFQYIPRLTI